MSFLVCLPEAVSDTQCSAQRGAALRRAVGLVLEKEWKSELQGEGDRKQQRPLSLQRPGMLRSPRGTFPSAV